MQPGDIVTWRGNPSVPEWFRGEVLSTWSHEVYGKTYTYVWVLPTHSNTTTRWAEKVLRPHKDGGAFFVPQTREDTRFRPLPQGYTISDE